MRKHWIKLVAFLVLPAIAVAATLPSIHRGWDSNGGRTYLNASDTTVFTIGTTGITSALTTTLTGAADCDSTLDVDGATSLGMTLTVAGAVAANSTVDVTGFSTFAGGVKWSGTDVSLTSPTVTFDASGASTVVLTSDENQTAICPTGGTLDQIVVIRSGAGSNTMRFDDGTSTVLGANITLTEGEYDSLTLQCISADGDEWAAVAAHDN